MGNGQGLGFPVLNATDWKSNRQLHMLCMPYLARNAWPPGFDTASLRDKLVLIMREGEVGASRDRAPPKRCATQPWKEVSVALMTVHATQATQPPDCSDVLYEKLLWMMARDPREPVAMEPPWPPATSPAWSRAHIAPSEPCIIGCCLPIRGESSPLKLEASETRVPTVSWRMDPPCMIHASMALSAPRPSKKVHAQSCQATNPPIAHLQRGHVPFKGAVLHHHERHQLHAHGPSTTLCVVLGEGAVAHAHNPSDLLQVHCPTWGIKSKQGNSCGMAGRCACERERERCRGLQNYMH